MLIWSMLSIIGLWIVHRTLRTGEVLQIFSVEHAVRIRMISFLTVVGLNFLLRDVILLLSALNIVIFLSPWWVPMWIQRRRELLLKEQFVPILDQLIMSMKAGRGFRPSFQGCLERNTWHVRFVLKEFISALQYQKEITSIGRDPQIQLFFRELSQVDQSSHKPVDRLRALRRRLMMEKGFRQKSRQALLQVRFQSWIISGMYVLVLGYVQFDFGLRKHLGLVGFSSTLFLVGLITVQKMGRNYQWKI
jgi:Flp pilus assembly protein TadB